VTTLAPPLETQLQGYLDHLTIERGVAANTLSSYRRDLRRYFEHLTLRGVDDLAKASEDDVSEFLVALRRGDAAAGVVPLSAVSAARTLIAVRGLHRFAAAEGLAEIDVAQAVKPPTPGRRLPKSLSLDQVLALLAGAGGDSPSDGPLTLRNRALLELLYSTGARISEAVGLDVDDIDTHVRSVRWTPTWCVDVQNWRVAAAGHRPSFSMRAVAGCRGKARGRCCRTPPSGRVLPPGCPRTRCGIRLRRTCWTAGPTSVWCRSCSDTPRSRRRRSTPWSPCTRCAKCGPRLTRGRARRSEQT
jgi:Phage integrase, N-terminal SAM-like domain/Phage integrase family